jgi:hypothetical protein
MAVIETGTTPTRIPNLTTLLNGKGLGIIVLLQYGFLIVDFSQVLTSIASGNPGMGKTLTAEVIAEHHKQQCKTNIRKLAQTISPYISPRIPGSCNLTVSFLEVQR